MLKIVAVSDTHSNHLRYNLPVGDLLIHAGDLTDVGNIEEFEEVARWFKTLQFKHIVVTYGNHDRVAAFEPERVRKILTVDDRVHVLVDEGIEIEGLKIWGSPWCHMNSSYWVFSKRSEKELLEKYNKIPTGTDILITHTPPYYILDEVLPNDYHIGSSALRQEVLGRIKPKVCFFGHIHECGGQKLVEDKILFMNVAGRPASFDYFNPNVNISIPNK